MLKEAEGEHAEHWRKKNEEKARLEAEQRRRFNLANQQKESGRALSYGYRYDSQMEADYEFVKNAKEGDITNVYYQGDIRTIVKQKDGSWKYDDGSEAGKLFSSDQIRQLKEYTHLPVLEGGVPTTKKTKANILDDAINIDVDYITPADSTDQSLTQEQIDLINQGAGGTIPQTPQNIDTT